jgi:O-antigen ligase
MGNFKTSILSFFKNSNNSLSVLEYLIALILITLPLKNIFVSIATITFVIVSIFKYKKSKKNIKKEFFLPISLFVLMACSLLWTRNFENSLFGLQKTLPLLVIPVTFFLLPQFSKDAQNKTYKWYSYSMVGFAVFYLLCAIISYISTNTISVFFSNDLVPLDPGAIYMSVFASFALFYFTQIPIKNNLEKTALTILTIFIFLLSSKSIITIDFIIIVCYYAFFAKINRATKALTILSVTFFLFFSISYVKEVKERFLIEYETAFIDNTLHSTIEKTENNIHNVSINEALHQEKFQQNDFFPGTALR